MIFANLYNQTGRSILHCNFYINLPKKRKIMPLSNKWNEEKTIYNINTKNRDMSKLIYRDSNGFEAFVVGETNDTWKIEGNGIKCSVWKSMTKSKIIKVPSDYILRKCTTH